MMDKKRGDADWPSVVKGAAIGAGGSVAMSLALSALGAELVSREVIAETSIDALTAAILILSAACGALLAETVTGHHRLPVCMLAGGIYFISLLSCTALLFGGVYRAVGVSGLTVLGGCGAVVLLGLKESGNGRGRRHAKNRNWRIVQK